MATQKKLKEIPEFDPTKPFEVGEDIPEFDPTKPFEVGEDIPEFDPNQPFEVEGGPTFLPETTTPPEQSQIEEAPADLTGRVALKAFGTDIESKLSKYKELNPDKDVMINPYNKTEIIARVKGTTKWLKEDPGIGAWLEYPKEIVNDITDLAWEAVSAPLQGKAAVGGFLAGTAAAPFAGPAAPAVPFAGATAAGTLAGQALEGVRQGIGAIALGQKPEMPSWTSSALAQGAANLLFGVGGTPGQIAKTVAKNPDAARRALESASKYFLPKGQAPSPEEAKAATEFLTNTITNKGVLSKVKSKFLPLYFGGDELNIKTAMEDAPKKLIDGLINQGLKIDPNKKWSYRELSQAVAQQGKGKGPSQVALSQIKVSIDNAKQKFSKQFEGALNAIPVKFNVDKYKGPLLKRLDDLAGDNSEAANYEANQIKAILGEYFAPKKIKMEVPETTMQPVAGLLDEAGNPIMRPVTTTKEVFVPGSQNWTAQSMQSLANRLTDLTDPQMTFAQAQKKTVTNKLDQGAIAETANLIRNDIYGAIKDQKLRSNYKQFMDLQRNIMDGFANEKRAATTLSNAFNNSAKQKSLLQSLREFDKKMKTDLESSAKLAWVGKRFDDPALEQTSSFATSTSRVMRPAIWSAGLGSAAGGSMFGPVGAAFGGLLGGGLGGLTATDAVLNKILAGTEALRRGPVGQTAQSIEQSKWIYPQQVIPWLNIQRIRNEEPQK